MYSVTKKNGAIAGEPDQRGDVGRAKAPDAKDGQVEERSPCLAFVEHERDEQHERCRQGDDGAHRAPTVLGCLH